MPDNLCNLQVSTLFVVLGLAGQVDLVVGVDATLGNHRDDP